LFIAVWPPDDVVEHLRSLQRKDRRGVRFVSPDRWHVTLRFFGEADPDEIAAAMDDVPVPVTARLGPAVDVISDRVLVVPVSGLDDLARAIARSTRDIGQPPPKRRFNGHLTIARLKPGANLAPTIGTRIEAEFPVGEVTLVRSRLEPTGARYDIVETWSLR
jgi:2'-5' RNA ligase